MFTAVTTMEKITFLIKKLQSSASSNPNLTDLVFLKGEFFSWDHTTHTITFNPSDPLANAYLLHEFGHALLGHTDYSHDIELLQIERAAWDKAVKIAKEYEVSLDSDTVEDSLDTYRDWLHDRSLCPKCSATGIQIGALVYRCVACNASWRVNEARNCALRRYSTKKHSL